MYVCVYACMYVYVFQYVCMIVCRCMTAALARRVYRVIQHEHSPGCGEAYTNPIPRRDGTTPD